MNAELLLVTVPLHKTPIPGDGTLSHFLKPFQIYRGNLNFKFKNLSAWGQLVCRPRRSEAHCLSGCSPCQQHSSLAAISSEKIMILVYYWKILGYHWFVPGGPGAGRAGPSPGRPERRHGC